MSLIPILNKQRQEDKEFKAALLCIEIGTSLEHTPHHCLKKLNKSFRQVTQAVAAAVSGSHLQV